MKALTTLLFALTSASLISTSAFAKNATCKDLVSICKHLVETKNFDECKAVCRKAVELCREEKDANKRDEALALEHKCLH